MASNTICSRACAGICSRNWDGSRTRAESSHAAAFASNTRERELLRRRAEALAPPERPVH